MELQSSTALVLCGKWVTEDESSRCSKNNDAIKLPDAPPTTVVLLSEIVNRDSVGDDDFFRVNLASTSPFGKLLIYSPELASTHDVVSHNFAELSIGAVCVADVQLKGRGRKMYGYHRRDASVLIYHTGGGWPYCATCAVFVDKVYQNITEPAFS